MKLFFLILLGISLLCSCGRTFNEPLNNQISAYIQTNCRENIPCKIQIKDATDFSWDKLIVFGRGVEPSAIRTYIGLEFSSESSYYSRKWFFMKDNKIVRFEEHILYEIDVPFKNGDVDFDIEYEERIKDSAIKMALFPKDSMFEVKKSNTSTVEYYRLQCDNCMH